MLLIFLMIKKFVDKIHKLPQFPFRINPNLACFFKICSAFIDLKLDWFRSLAN